MTPKRLDLHDIRFEPNDAEIFRIPDTKTRLDTLQHYCFPRLEVLLHDTVDLIQEVYGINPYERMKASILGRASEQYTTFGYGAGDILRCNRYSGQRSCAMSTVYLF